MKIITISGLDGSGKSTQIQLLKNHLGSQGKRVFYFHAINFSLAKKITEFRNKYCLIYRFLRKCEVKQEKSVTRANSFQIGLRKIFLKIDIRRFEKLQKKLNDSGYDYILSDRYFYDSIVNVEYLSTKISTLIDKSITKPDTAIYLQTSPESIMQRERVPDQGLEYLKAKKEIYDTKVTDWNLKIINGNRNKEEIFEEIKNYVN